jgi:hypothetical protein
MPPSILAGAAVSAEATPANKLLMTAAARRDARKFFMDDLLRVGVPLRQWRAAINSIVQDVSTKKNRLSPRRRQTVGVQVR